MKEKHCTDRLKLMFQDTQSQYRTPYQQEIV